MNILRHLVFTSRRPIFFVVLLRLACFPVFVNSGILINLVYISECVCISLILFPANPSESPLSMQLLIVVPTLIPTLFSTVWFFRFSRRVSLTGGFFSSVSPSDISIVSGLISVQLSLIAAG